MSNTLYKLINNFYYIGEKLFKVTIILCTLYLMWKYGIFDKIIYALKTEEGYIKKGYGRFKLDHTKLHHLEDLNLPFEIYIPNKDIKRRRKTAVYIPKWCSFVLINAKRLYPFFEKNLIKVYDPSEGNIDKQLINSLLKDLNNLDKNK